ncbi:MAG: metallophosphoesterase [Pyrinomonadaceae bacterium]
MNKTIRTFKYSILAIMLLGAAALMWGFLLEPNLLLVNNYDLKIKNWNPALNNFKIVAIGDIHAGSNFINERKIRRIVAEANAQDADVIVLLGDYVSESLIDHSKLNMPVETIAENLKGLRARYGVFAVMGNHDGYFNIPEIRKSLTDEGYKVLENEAVSIEKNGQKLRIVGLPDLLSTNTPDNGIPNAKAGLDRLENKEGNIIVLAHNPDDIASVTGSVYLSPDLVLFLAAHTHGGQVRVPFFGALIVPTQMGRKYAAGHFVYEGIDCFVTMGIGTSILPVRFAAPPEISVLNISSQ